MSFWFQKIKLSMNFYKVLNNQKFSIDNYSIVPIRYGDRLSILKWRNEQLYHLRQDKILTESDQDNYFINIVNKLFDQDRPNQLLFSFMKDNICIGYGGILPKANFPYQIDKLINCVTELEKEFGKEINSN